MRCWLLVLLSLLFLAQSPGYAAQVHDLSFTLRFYSDDGTLSNIGNFTSSFPHNVQADNYFQLFEVNNQLYLVPEDQDGLIRQYSLTSFAEVDQYTYPHDIPNVPDGIAWDPFILDNGTLRFFATIWGDTDTQYIISNLDSEVVKNFTVGPSLESVYSGGSKRLDQYSGNAFSVFHANEDNSGNDSVEIVAANIHTFEKSSFLVDSSNAYYQLRYYNSQLYAISSTEEGTNLVSNGSGSWITEFPLNLNFNDIITSFFHNNSYYTISTSGGIDDKIITIKQWNVTVGSTIDSFSFMIDYNFFDVLNTTLEDDAVVLPLVEAYSSPDVFGLRIFEDEIVFDHYNIMFKNEGDGWQATKMLPKLDEIPILSLPFNTTTRIELVTHAISHPSTETSTSEMPLSPWAIVIILPIISAKYRQYRS